MSAAALRMGNRAVIKRFGFIVETLGLATPQETEPWRAQLSRGYSPLDPQLPREGRYDSRWQVLVNPSTGPSTGSGGASGHRLDPEALEAQE